MPPPYLFPFSVPCTGDQTIQEILRPFPILYLAASSTLLEMGRTGPLWKTSPPSSPRWTPASPSTKRPPYPSSRAQSELLELSRPYGLLNCMLHVKVKIISKLISNTYSDLVLSQIEARPKGTIGEHGLQ